MFFLPGGCGGCEGCQPLDACPLQLPRLCPASQRSPLSGALDEHCSCGVKLRHAGADESRLTGWIELSRVTHSTLGVLMPSGLGVECICRACVTACLRACVLTRQRVNVMANGFDGTLECSRILLWHLFLPVKEWDGKRLCMVCPWPHIRI